MDDKFKMSEDVEVPKRRSHHLPYRQFLFKRPKRIIKKQRKIKDSIPQRIFFEELQRRLGYNLKYNFPVRTWSQINVKGKPSYKIWRIRYIDVADIRTMIAYEYDGERFHKKVDTERDNELKRAGWKKIIHITKYNMQEILDNLYKKE